MTMAETSSEPFRALASSLKASGYESHASRLEDTLNGTWTTSSELIGELGSAVLEIRRECSPLTPDQKRLVKDCLREVHRAWPGFGFLRGIWYRWF
jgi:hypothetical protein